MENIASLRQINNKKIQMFLKFISVGLTNILLTIDWPTDLDLDKYN